MTYYYPEMQCKTDEISYLVLVTDTPRYPYSHKRYNSLVSGTRCLPHTFLLMSSGDDHGQEAIKSCVNDGKVTLAEELSAYYADQNVDVENLVAANSGSPLLRFIRLNPRYDQHETLSCLAVSLVTLSKPFYMIHALIFHH